MRSPSMATRPPEAHSFDLAGRQVGEHVRADALRHRAQRVAGVVERLTGTEDLVTPGEESHSAIVPSTPGSPRDT